MDFFFICRVVRFVTRHQDIRKYVHVRTYSVLLTAFYDSYLCT